MAHIFKPISLGNPAYNWFPWSEGSETDLELRNPVGKEMGTETKTCSSLFRIWRILGSGVRRTVGSSLNSKLTLNPKP